MHFAVILPVGSGKLIQATTSPCLPSCSFGQFLPVAGVLPQICPYRCMFLLSFEGSGWTFKQEVCGTDLVEQGRKEERLENAHRLLRSWRHQLPKCLKPNYFARSMCRSAMKWDSNCIVMVCSHRVALCSLHGLERQELSLLKSPSGKNFSSSSCREGSVLFSPIAPVSCWIIHSIAFCQLEPLQISKTALKSLRKSLGWHQPTLRRFLDESYRFAGI